MTPATIAIIAARILLALVAGRMASYRNFARPFFPALLTGALPLVGAAMIVTRKRLPAAKDLLGRKVSGKQAERLYFRRMWQRAVSGPYRAYRNLISKEPAKGRAAAFFRGAGAAVMTVLTLPLTLLYSMVRTSVFKDRVKAVKEEPKKKLEIEEPNTEAEEEKKNGEGESQSQEQDKAETIDASEAVKNELKRQDEVIDQFESEGSLQEDTAQANGLAGSPAAVNKMADKPTEAASQPQMERSDEPRVSQNASAPTEQLEGLFIPDRYDARSRNLGQYVFFVPAREQRAVAQLLEGLGINYRLEIPARRDEYFSKGYSRVARGGRCDFVSEKNRVQKVYVRLDHKAHKARMVERKVPANFKPYINKALEMKRDFEEYSGIKPAHGAIPVLSNAYTIYCDESNVYLEKGGDIICTLSYDEDLFARVTVQDKEQSSALGISESTDGLGFLASIQDAVLKPINIRAAREDHESGEQEVPQLETGLKREMRNMFLNRV